MSGVKTRKRRRWPGTRGQAAWLLVKRAYGGERNAANGFLSIAARDFTCDLTTGLKLLQLERPIAEMEPIWNDLD